MPSPIHTYIAFPDSCMCYCVCVCIALQSPFIAMMNANYCNLEEQTLTLLLRSVRANCGLKVLKLVGNNLTGKGTFILSELREREREREKVSITHPPSPSIESGCDEVQ